jgi:hypothetical protein
MWRSGGSGGLRRIEGSPAKKLLQSGQFDDKPSTKRAASSLAKAVSGAEIVDATKAAAAAAKSRARRPRMKR